MIKKRRAKKKERKTDGRNSPKKKGQNERLFEPSKFRFVFPLFPIWRTEVHFGGLTLLEFCSGVESRPPLWTQRLSD
jgi:hypothetical protein